MQKSTFLKILCCILLAQAAICGKLSANDAPPNWPWHGFVLTSNAASSPDDILLLKKSFPINAVRLTFKPKHYSHELKIPQRDVWDRLVTWLNVMLDTCKANNITAIVSFNQLLYAYNIDQWEPQFWDDARYHDIKLAYIAKLVQECASRGPELGAYEFLTEAIVVRGPKKLRPSSWLTFRKEIVDTVRRFDKSRYICITAGPGALAGGYRDYTPLDDERIIYTAHMYHPHDYTYQGILQPLEPCAYPGIISGSYYDKAKLLNSLGPLIEFQKKYKKKYVWISEFSAARWANGSDQYLKDITDIFKDNQWSWTYFSFNEYHGWNPYYNSSYSPNDKSIFSKQYVGPSSERWRTLQQIFGTMPDDSSSPTHSATQAP